jgi:chromosome segregation ATPase
MSSTTFSQEINLDSEDSYNPHYKTPLNALANSWLESRELWKSKYMSLKVELKSYRDIVANLTESREAHKQKYKTAKNNYYELTRQFNKKNEIIQTLEKKAKELTEKINKQNEELENLKKK